MKWDVNWYRRRERRSGEKDELEALMVMSGVDQNGHDS